MKQNPLPTYEYKKFSIETRWARTSLRFMQSPMADMSLDSLAQNLNLAWPFRGERNRPNDYIGFSFAELKALPEFKGRPDMIEFLVEILEETLAFDQHDQLMQAKAATAAIAENPFFKTLERVGAPLDFPLPLVALTSDAREYCRLEGLETLKDFVLFAQRVSQKAVVFGDLRMLLNALAHRDEEALARFIPVRRGTTGLHLFEGIALCIRAFDDKVIDTLAEKTPADVSAQVAIETISGMVPAYTDYFQGELTALQTQLDKGETLQRALRVINDPIMEVCVSKFLKPYVTESEVAEPEVTTPPIDMTQRSARAPLAFVKRFFSFGRR